MSWVRRTLWNRYKDDAGADGELPEDVELRDAPVLEPGGGGVVYVTKNPIPRDFYIRRADAEQHGYTRGCPGCSSWFRGLGRQPHSAACRERFRALLADDERVRSATAKRVEFETQEEDKRRKKEEKKERKRKAVNEGDDAERGDPQPVPVQENPSDKLLQPKIPPSKPLRARV